MHKGKQPLFSLAEVPNLALPQLEDFPAQISEGHAIAAVSGSVSINFRGPIRGVGFRPRSDLAEMPMPEASVYKHYLLVPW